MQGPLVVPPLLRKPLFPPALMGARSPSHLVLIGYLELLQPFPCIMALCGRPWSRRRAYVFVDNFGAGGWMAICCRRACIFVDNFGAFGFGCVLSRHRSGHGHARVAGAVRVPPRCALHLVRLPAHSKVWNQSHIGENRSRQRGRIVLRQPPLHRITLIRVSVPNQQYRVQEQLARNRTLEVHIHILIRIRARTPRASRHPCVVRTRTPKDHRACRARVVRRRARASSERPFKHLLFFSFLYA